MNKPALVPDYFQDYNHRIKLTGDLEKIRNILFDGKGHRVSDIAKELGLPECSVSSQIRHLRKIKWGAYDIRLIRIKNFGSVYQMVNI